MGINLPVSIIIMDGSVRGQSGNWLSDLDSSYHLSSIDKENKMKPRKWYYVLFIILWLCLGLETPVSAQGSYVLFESGQVRPLCFSPDGSQLFATNTPDNRLEIFDVQPTGLNHVVSVPVGMEPVAVAARTNDEVWVVNHLSDSISIVDVSANPPNVVRTLFVGDEPRDIVFAGPGGNRAFVTSTHRGQNSPFNDPQELITPGIGRGDVWVFDALNLGDTLEGTPLTIITLFCDTPRALAATPDGSTVYAAAFNSGNQTTVLGADIINGGLTKPPPTASADGEPAPPTGLIVKFDGTDWVDSGDPVTGISPQIWTNRVRFSLPDNDVFVINANANPPGEVGNFSGVGTTIFNMIVNPVNDKVYVSNTEARNFIRFEGPGSFSTTVRGHIAESRITVIDDPDVIPRHLNKHITSYAEPLGTPTENALSVAQPLGMAITSNGQWLAVAAFGSSKIGVYNTQALENDSFGNNIQIPVSGGGPTGLAYDEANNRLYALTRFDNSISIIDTQTLQEIDHLALFNPEPSSVVAGRPFLYDAALTSSRGDSSCASCHIFGGMDHLAWDLGDPDGMLTASPNQYVSGIDDALKNPFFHPMKGPMTTQSLRGLARNGPMHWRGDRTGITADPDETLEEQAFEDFNVAFEGLLGRAVPLTGAEMDAFAKFALQLAYPPNPVRNLDNSLTTEQQTGLNTFLFEITTGGNRTCTSCHALDVTAGKFGTDGLQGVEGPEIAEDFKVPHLRNMYQKVGMFGSTGNPTNGEPFMGDQIRGFGFRHSGADDSVDTFLSHDVFNLTNTQRSNLESFLHVFDSDLTPIVGQQVTITLANSNRQDVVDRAKLLYRRARVTNPVPEADLIAKFNFGGEQRGAVLIANGQMSTDKSSESLLRLQRLVQIVISAGEEVTLTAVPPSSGIRMGIDRDEDGILDGDE